MTITTGTNPKALWPGINRWWGDAYYDEHTVEYTELFDRETSDQSYEEDVQSTGFGLAPSKPQGTAVQYEDETQGYVTRYTHVAYALGYIVTAEEQRDNLYERVAKARTRKLAFSMRQTKENVGANIYNRAFNSSFLGGDGVELLSTAHPSRSGNQSNELATPADLSEASLEDLIIQIMKATNDVGLKISLMPKKLLVAPDEFFNANRILGSVLQNDTANNAVNVLKATNALPEGIKINHYFTDADAWFIRTNAQDGMKYFERDAIMFTEDGDFDTDNMKYKAYERYSFKWSDWRGLFGTPGA